MERSSEVEAAVRRLYDAMRDDDADLVGDLIADDDLVFVGTDVGEWWQDRPSMLDVFRDQLDSAGGFDIQDESPVGYAEGDVGWFADQPSMRLPDGAVVPMRHTGVLRRRDGDWLFVQSHLSVGAEINDELFEGDG